MKFCKNGTVVEAIQANEALRGLLCPASLTPPAWLNEGIETGTISFGNFHVKVHTREGKDRCAMFTDWIICGAQRELDVCKPDVFEATYELVDA